MFPAFYGHRCMPADERLECRAHEAYTRACCDEPSDLARGKSAACTSSDEPSAVVDSARDRVPELGKETLSGFAFCGFCPASLFPPSASAREERKVVTSLICDLVGFTASSEVADPEDVDRMLAVYFDAVRAQIEGHGGVAGAVAQMGERDLRERHLDYCAGAVAEGGSFCPLRHSSMAGEAEFRLLACPRP